MENQIVQENGAVVNTKKDYRYISILRVLSMFAVVAVHVICYLPASSNAVDFRISCILKTIIGAAAVPIFYMISGALFLDPNKEIPIKKLFSKYILRIFLDILIFASAFSLMEIVFTNKGFKPLDILIAIKNAMTGNSWGHFWFLYAIMGLYFITPILRGFTSSASDKELLIVIGVLYLFTILLPIIADFTTVKLGFTVPFAQSVFYFITGYAIHSKKLVIKNWLSWIFIAVSIAFIIGISFIPGYLIVEGNGIKNISWIGIMALGIFSLFMNYINGPTKKFEKFLSDMSFGVYIFHTVVINLFYKGFHVSPEKYNIYLIWIVTFICTSIFSVLITFICKKIPGLKKIL